MGNIALATLLFSAVLCAQDTASLKVTGGASPLTLTKDDLSHLPRETVALDEHGSKASYEGVPLREVLKKAGVPMGKDLKGKALAAYVLAKAHDGYQVVYAIAELDPEFTDAKVIVADTKDGKPIPGEQGPLRIVSSTDKRPARCVRMLEELTVVHLAN